jgi:nicotinic acid phosphoribosyltransferase
LNTIIVGSVLIEAGVKNIGIRLDSGDLGALSKKCRKVWNEHVPNLRLMIAASDDLYE